MGEATYISLQKNYEQVYAKIVRVIDRIENHPEYDEDINIIFLGNFEYFNDLDIYDLSNGDFTNLGVFRGVRDDSLREILKERFGENYTICDTEKRNEIFDNYYEEINNMNGFPHQDSIKKFEDVFVVKFN